MVRFLKMRLLNYATQILNEINSPKPTVPAHRLDHIEWLCDDIMKLINKHRRYPNVGKD